MAERRMFSKKVINSGRFLKMPASTQCLYFHLGLNADDDGVVEAYAILQSTSATEDDLRILVAKGFVVILNEDLVSYITDWKENNKLRADRKIDSIYKDLLLQVLPETNLLEKKQRADIKKISEIQQKAVGQPLDVQWTTKGQPMDGIGKDRIGEDSIGKYSKKEILSERTELVADSVPAPVITLQLNTGKEHPIYQKDIDQWQSIYSNTDVVAELKKMKGWCLANPTRRKTKSGINRFINNWLSKEQDRNRFNPVDIAYEAPKERKSIEIPNQQEAESLKKEIAAMMQETYDGKP